VCDFQTVPILIRPGTVLPVGSRDDRPDYAYEEDVTLRVYEFPDGGRSTVTVPGPTGDVAATFEVAREGNTLTATRRGGAAPWALLSGPSGTATRVAADTDRCSVPIEGG
jgi:alpha-D-xyloside xylohydrolase